VNVRIKFKHFTGFQFHYLCVMKMVRYITLSGLLLISTVGYTQPSASNTSNTDTGIAVIQMSEPMPDSCKVLWQLHVGDNNYNLGCTYDEILDFAKLLAKRGGGNVLKITTIRPHDNWCDCYRLYGTVMHRKNLWNADKGWKDSIHKSKFGNGDTAKYAILYFYRPKAEKGSLIAYKVSMGNNDLCRVKNNSVEEVKIYKEGKDVLSATTESPTNLYVDVKYGQEYYIRCTVKSGVFVGEPKMELMGKEVGMGDYEFIKNQK
jgi:hypothetical protein